MVDFSERWVLQHDFRHKILLTIRRSVRTYVLIAALAVTLDCDLEELTDYLATMDADGEVEVWPECERGPAVTLTPLSGRRLAVEIQGRRWRSIHRNPPPIQTRKQSINFEAVVDPRTTRADADDLPRPIFFVGQSTIMDGPECCVNDAEHGHRCKACGYRRLKGLEYCLFCSRWGMDREQRTRTKRAMQR